MVEAKPEIRFFYHKSQQFRVIHSDGAMGSITPLGLLHVAFFSERPAIPQSQTHTLLPDGKLSEPTTSEGKTGIVREIDVDVMMTKQTAAQLRDWLSERISELETLETQQNGKE